MKLSTLSRALPLVVIASSFFPRPSFADQCDNGNEYRFFSHGTPTPDDDRYIIHYNDEEGHIAIQDEADIVHLELGPQKAVAVKIGDSKKLVGLANKPGVGYIEKDQVRFPLGLGGVRGHGHGGSSSLESFAEELLKSTNSDKDLEKTSFHQQGRKLADTTPYGIPMVQADQLAPGADSANIRVCIVDSGYDQTHEDLPGTAANPSTGIAGGSGEWGFDGCSHGTHVAGTIVGLGNNAVGVKGVIANGSIEVYNVRVFSGTGCGWSYASSLINAVNQCYNNAGGKKVVVNMSLGGSGSSATEDSFYTTQYNTGNMLPIAAAGNSGTTAFSYPASYDNVVSVAAIDVSSNLASFSQRNSQVELSGPGVDVLSTVGMGTGDPDSSPLTIGGNSYQGTLIEFAATGVEATGQLVDCGYGRPTDGPCPGTGGHVCLIQRGSDIQNESISFAEKISMCEAGNGAVAAVIYNNVQGGFSGTMGAGNSAQIPALGISQADGQAIMASLGQDPTLTATVNSGGGNYAYYSGTSMATPHVVGVAALVWSHHSECSAAQIRRALQAEALDLGVAGRDTSFGYGLVQAVAAEAYLGGDCGASKGPQCSLVGALCSSDADCCNTKCKGKAGSKTCK